MARPLEAWQERLERHFAELAATRRESGFPIFALEHGLSPDEFREIAEQLRSRLAAGLRLGPHWLLWVVYATEQGYAYDGHEYWVSFEENTAHWREHASGRQLRGYFSKFTDSYHGVTPTGPWAEWFRNIAWPITHAILPRYLQLQFARALYEASHQLGRVQPLTAKTAGALLANNAWNASSRFHEFLEQVELAGRIVLALLDQGTVSGQGPIYPPTLERIVADLERVRRAGEWLQEARRVVADHFHGVERGRGGGPPRDAESPTGERVARPPPNLRPTLALRQSGSANWSAVLEIPDFAGVAQLSPELSAFLRSTRCSIAGVSDDPFPRGWLLSATQRRVLKSWPNPQVPIVSFEKRNALLDNIINKECRIGPGPVWLFGVGSDATARELAGHIVRPGHSYILLSREPLRTDAAFASSCTTTCAGITAITLAIPVAVTVEHINQMQKLGLQVARHIHLWPAGLAVRGWDGEGHGDWLTTETPCFGVMHDYPVDEYTLRLNHGPETTIEGQRAGEPVFVRLQPLPPGRHVLSVKARRVGLAIGSQALKDLEGSVELKVRDPAPWIPGTISHSGLALSLDPPDPSLDVFWEGSVDLSLLGPEGRSVTCSVLLARKNGELALPQEVGTFDLPITPSTWAARFQRFANDENRAWQYLEAASGVFVIDGDELGKLSLPLEREGRPLRWMCRYDHRTTRVRLLDDTGLEEGAAVRFLPFRNPTAAQALPTDHAVAGLVVEEPGGLFVANHAAHGDALIVSSSHGGLSLSDLLVEPQLPALESDADLTSLFDSIDLWHAARLAGPLADSRRRHLLRRLISSLFAQLCGLRWSDAEAAFLANPQSAFARQQLEKAVGGQPGFAVILRRDCQKIDISPDAAAEWFADVATRYAVAAEVPLCTFALWMALSPSGLRAAFRNQFDDLLKQVRQQPVLLRGARLAALHAATHTGAPAITYVPRWACSSSRSTGRMSCGSAAGRWRCRSTRRTPSTRRSWPPWCATRRACFAHARPGHSRERFWRALSISRRTRRHSRSRWTLPSRMRRSPATCWNSAKSPPTTRIPKARGSLPPRRHLSLVQAAAFSSWGLPPNNLARCHRR